MRKHLQHSLDALETQHQLRALPSAPLSGIDLLSNDYLGIAQDKALYAQFIQQWLTTGGGASSASASRLLGGNATSASTLEASATTLFARPALYLNSGYHANIGILPALTDKNDLIIADKAIHASLIDGARLSSARLLRYPHQNLSALASLLAKHRAHYRQVWIVSESVFSMDGSCSDLIQLQALKKQYDAQLYIDEAHAVGIYGNGLGLAYELDVFRDIDVCVLPCAKALGSYGAFVLSDALTRDYLINHCRSLIFASALPPIVSAWTNHIINHLPDFAPQRQRLMDNSQALRHALAIQSTSPSNSPIIPLIIGDNATTMRLAHALATENIHVGAIRYPTVAQGHAQLRLCVHANLSAKDINQIATRIQHQCKTIIGG